MTPGQRTPKPKKPARNLRDSAMLRLRFAHRRSRLFRWSFRLLVIVPLTMCLSVLIVTQTRVARTLVLPVAESLTGLEFDAGAVRMTARGTFTLDDVRVRIPGLSGPAGEFASVSRIEVTPTWSSALSGSMSVSHIRLDSPAIRVSQSMGESKALNVSSLSLPAGSGSAPANLPEITIAGGSLELGEHDAEVYRPLKRLHVDGRLSPAADHAGEYVLTLQEVRGAKPGGGIVLSGRIAKDGVEAEMVGVHLDEWGPGTVPQSIRSVVERLDLRGSIARTKLWLRDGVLIGPTLVLENVETTLPVPAESGESEPLRMTGVNGQVEFLPDGFHADISGFVRDLPYAVDLRYHGFAADSPFECRLESRGFVLDRNPQLLPWLPEVVREQLVRFRSPSARLNAVANVNRVIGPDGAADLRVSGEVEFADGQASYNGFPYAFHNMSGRIVFGGDQAEVEWIKGTSPGGAELLAHATVSPMGDDPYMTVDVTVGGVPVDDTLLAGMSGGKADLVRALLLNEHFDALRALGIGQDEVPPFESGGEVGVEIHLVREPERRPRWTQDIVVSAERLCMVPEWFPVPIVGEHVRLRITDNRIEVIGGEFRGLNSGPATVEATIDHGGEDLTPDIRIGVRDVVIDDNLTYALARRPITLPDGRTTTLASLLDELGVSGALGVTLNVLSREDGSIGFEASVDLADAAMRPTVRDGRTINWQAIGGRIDVDERGVTLNITADSTCETGGATHANGPITISGRIDASLTGDPGEPVPVTVSLRIDANELDLSAPVEALAGVFSKDVEAQLVGLRERFRPEGSASFVVTIDGKPGEEPETLVRVDGARHAAFDFFGRRCSISGLRGNAEFSARSTLIRFNALAGSFLCEGQEAGSITINGGVRVVDGEAAFTDPSTSAVINLIGSRFENPIVDGAVSTSAGEAFTKVWRDVAARGAFDADVSLGPAHSSDGVAVRLRPGTLSFVWRGQRVDVGATSGEARFTKTGGSFEQLRCVSGDVSGVFAGWWRASGDDTYSMTLTGDARAPRLSAPVRALIPEQGEAALNNLKLACEGEVTVRDMEVTYSRAGDEKDAASSFTGVVGFSELSMLVGVPVEGARGECNLYVEGVPGQQWPIVRIDALAQSMNVLGLKPTAVRCVLANAGDQGTYAIERLSADLFGGRVAGDGWVQAHAEPPSMDYYMRMKCSDVRFNPIVEGMKAHKEGVPPAQSPPDDRTRGLLDATMTLSGVAGDESTKRGRGEVRVSGGEVLSMPLVLPLLEVSNLQLPTGSVLDLALVSFALEGDTLIIEDASIVSQSVWIYGLGSASWPDLALDMHFFSRSSRGIPLLSMILEGIRNDMVSTRVTGTLADPSVRLEGFRDAQRLLGDASGQRLSAHERRVESVLGERSDTRRTPDYDPMRVRPSSPLQGRP